MDLSEKKFLEFQNATSELKSTNCDLFFTIESIERVAIAVFFFSSFPFDAPFYFKAISKYYFPSFQCKIWRQSLISTQLQSRS